MNLKNKTVLVTGASSGIGEYIAKAFANEGAIVLINYRKNKSGAEKVLYTLRETTKADMYHADLADKTQVISLFSEISKKHKNIDILINNAGEAVPGNIYDEDLWDYQFKNNFFSAVDTINAFLSFNTTEILRKIINITSMYGLVEMGDSDFVQYSASKAALNSYTFTLARKLEGKVLVNAVAPGWTITPARNGTPEESFKHCEDLMTIKRFIKPEEVADLVIAIAKNDAISGEIYKIDGGLKSPVV